MMYLIFIIYILIAFFPAPSAAISKDAAASQGAATSRAIIIGGGPKPTESQASIEKNTTWIINILKKNYTNDNLKIFFTDGNLPDNDVYKVIDDAKKTNKNLPLSLIYNDTYQRKYYNSHIADNIRSADAFTVTAELSQSFNNLEKNDELLIIFQGHGSHNKKTNKNTIRLWNDSKLTVKKLEQLMSKADNDATIRFVFPQCFSGGFANLLYKKATIDAGISAGNRCGFFAQNEHIGSEGCTPSVETSTYRDYSSFFFSAISGQSISGESINIDTDLNGDDNISLRDAHLYALANAFSVDYSFSTSEHYLKKWQPWYLRWLPESEPIQSNEYYVISKLIAKRFSIPTNDDAILKVTAMKLKENNDLIFQLKLKLSALTLRMNLIKKSIRQDLNIKPPELNNTHFQNVTLPESENNISKLIATHKDYSSLADAFHESTQLDILILNKSRRMVQMEKILHMRKLGRLLNFFNSFSNEKQKNEYQRILNCETASL